MCTGIFTITNHCSLFLDLFVFPGRCGPKLALWEWIPYRPHSSCVNWKYEPGDPGSLQEAIRLSMGMYELT